MWNSDASNQKLATAIALTMSEVRTSIGYTAKSATRLWKMMDADLTMNARSRYAARDVTMRVAVA